MRYCPECMHPTDDHQKAGGCMAGHRLHESLHCPCQRTIASLWSTPRSTPDPQDRVSE